MAALRTSLADKPEVLLVLKKWHKANCPTFPIQQKLEQQLEITQEKFCNPLALWQGIQMGQANCCGPETRFDSIPRME